jgi:two-component system sensor histidine kinase VanS
LGIKLKNKELVIEKLKILGQLILKLAIAYVIVIIVMEVLIDGIFNDLIANCLYDSDAVFYYWCVTNKSGIILSIIVIVFCLILYKFISKKVNEMNELYKSLNSILDENTQNVELPNSLWKFADKINKIKYEYVLNKKNAKEAEQKKNDLIMYMAHDLKTPLTSVIGYLTLLTDEEKISKDLQEKYIKIALDKSLRLEELTNEFFEITRYNLNDMPINKTNIDLSILFDQLLEEFYPMLEDRNLKLEVNKPNPLIYNADGDKLARAFGNLLKNAISYSYTNTTITIDIIESKYNIEITFKNRGTTIPKHKSEKIFDKFYRADESRGTNNGGAGLGLAITKDIIELHNGTIEARSENEIIEFCIILKK